MFLVWKQGKIERIWQNIFTLVFTAFLLISVSWLFIDETSILSKWHDSCHPLCRWDCNTHLFLISNTILPILTLEILSVAKQKSKKRRLKRSLSLSFNWVEKVSGLDSEIELLIKKILLPLTEIYRNFWYIVQVLFFDDIPIEDHPGGYLQDKILTFMKLSDMVSWHLNSAQF